MALAETSTVTGKVPFDSFRVRIAMIRVEKGWNISQAARACDLSAENWRKWEKIGRHPQDYEAVCKKIAEGSGYDQTWISVGGPLRSRCGVLLRTREWPVELLPPVSGQLALPGVLVASLSAVAS